MGADALEGNGITRKILYFFRDKALTPDDEPLRRIRKSRLLLFIGVQLAAFGVTMAITQTVGASLFNYALVPCIDLGLPNSGHWLPDRHPLPDTTQNIRSYCRPTMRSPESSRRNTSDRLHSLGRIRLSAEKDGTIDSRTYEC